VRRAAGWVLLSVPFAAMFVAMVAWASAVPCIEWSVAFR
jgi:hypothetical protein